MCRIFVILRKIIFLGFFVVVRRKLREFFFCVCVCQRISDSDDDCLFLRIFFWGCLVFEEGKLRERKCVVCERERKRLWRISYGDDFLVLRNSFLDFWCRG